MNSMAWRLTLPIGATPSGWYSATRQVGSASPKATVSTRCARSTGRDAYT